MAEPPADLASFYPDDYYHLPASVEELATVAEGERYKLEIVQRFVKAGRLLEIGPAVGGFAFLAKRAGFQVETIEMDARCCDFLRDVVGVGVTHTADARSVLQSSGQFEAIALWHVLEHLPDPWETLEAAAAALSPGGVLVLAAPNPDAIQFLIFKSYWTHLDAPRHLQLIPIRALRERAMSWGLLPIFSTTTDPGGLGWNAFGWQMSFRNLAEARVGKVPTLVGRAAGRIARPVERSGLRGSTYTLAFQKASRP
jgi:protein-L-isoaspartate O-methyltransferase